MNAPAVLLDRLPAELGERHQQVMDPTRLFVGRRVVIGDAVDQLLVLGADPPLLARLLAGGHRFGQLADILDHRTVAT